MTLKHSVLIFCITFTMEQSTYPASTSDSTVKEREIAELLTRLGETEPMASESMPALSGELSLPQMAEHQSPKAIAPEEDSEDEEAAATALPPAKIARTSEGKIICPICSKEIAGTTFNLTRHLETHSKGDLPCPECQINFSSEKTLSEHRAKIHGTVHRIQCTQPDCEKTFTDEMGLQKHIKFFHEKKYHIKCPECGTILSETSSLNKHLERKHGKKPLQEWCAYCSIQLDCPLHQPKNKAAEIERIASEAPQQKEVFTTKGIAQAMAPEEEGEESDDEEVEPIAIPTVPAATASALPPAHITRTKDGKMVCPICSREIKGAPYRLKRHLETHSKKDLPCPECTLHFSSPKALLEHRANKHKSVHRVQCTQPGCTTTLADEISLKRHIKFFHEKKNQIKCPEPGCGIILSGTTSLNKHLERKHGKKPLQE